jgi:hypothetical protein
VGTLLDGNHTEELQSVQCECVCGTNWPVLTGKGLEVSMFYIHTYIHISFRRSTNSVVQTVGHETCQKKTNKNTKQNRTDIQMSIPQSPNTNTVHNTMIE